MEGPLFFKAKYSKKNAFLLNIIGGNLKGIGTRLKITSIQPARRKQFYIKLRARQNNNNNNAT
jgi:hypothetical protein